MSIDWNKIWAANRDVFIMTGFEECPEEKRKGGIYLLSSAIFIPEI